MSEIILECSNLCKNYGRTAALKNVNLKLQRGHIVGLLGPNGSGKTTLIKIANQLLTPSSGAVYVNGIPLGIEAKKAISYLPDCTCLPEWMKVEEIVQLYKDFYEDFSKETAFAMLQNLHIDSQARLKTLSKGNQEKVQLILVMSRRADLYLLDEPMGGVDPATRDYILNTIIANYNEKSTVVISTHLIADVEKVLDEVLFIKDGEIVLRDSVDNIRDRQGMSIDALFREVFKC